MAEETKTTRGAKPERANKSLKIGVVDSISGEKTVRVVVNALVKHPLYSKYIRRRTRLLVHDARQEAKAGDTVEVGPCRPISKRKAWRLVRVLKRAANV